MTSKTPSPTTPVHSLTRKPRIYIAGPYTGETPAEIEANVTNAIWWGNKFLGEGFSPFVPHLTHFWELRHKHDYSKWLELDIAWLEKCDVMFVIKDSPGVLGEIRFCEQHGIPYHRVPEDVYKWRDTVWTHPTWLNEKPAGDPRFHKLLVEIGALHDERQRKYGSDDDPFANVRASELFGMPGYVGALVRAQDKMRRLANMTKGKVGDTPDESIRDAFMDLSVYGLIGLVLFEETNGRAEVTGGDRDA